MAYLTLLALFISCSLIDKIAVNSTANIIHAGSDEMLTEGNWHHFNRSVPANLKLIEGLWYGDKENKKLLTMLIKGYAAYGFATFETKGLAAIVEEEKSFDVEQAILMYEKAIYYGFEYLKLAGISQSTFMHKSFATQLSDRFLATFAEDDLVPL